MLLLKILRSGSFFPCGPKFTHSGLNTSFVLRFWIIENVCFNLHTMIDYAGPENDCTKLSMISETHLNPMAKINVNRDTWRGVSTTGHPTLRSNTVHSGLWLRANERNVILSF